MCIRRWASPRLALRYLAAALAGLLMIARAASALTPIGVVDTPGSAEDAVVVGSLLYVADGTSGLRIYDVSSPASPVLVGTSAAAANATRVVVGNGAAFVKDGLAGVRVIDVTIPSTPVLLTTIPALTFSTLYEPHLNGNRLYLSEFASGVRALDVSFPALPLPLGTYTGVQNGSRIEVVGDLVLATNGLAPGRIADFSNPFAPVDLGPLPLNGASWGVDIAHSADRAFVTSNAGITVADVSEPAAAHSVGYVSMPLARIVEARGRMLYVSTDTTIQIFDASALPTSVPSADVDLTNLQPNAIRALRHVRIGDLVYASLNSNTAGLGSTLAVIDVSNADAPAVVGSVALPGDAWGLDYRNGHVFVALDQAGLAIVDVSSPSAPQVVGSVDTPGRAFDVSVTGSLACVADTSSLQLIDVSLLASPAIIGTMPTFGSSYDVQAVGALAYVTEIGGVRIVSLATPAAPATIGVLPVSGSNQHVNVAGPYAYVLGASALSIFDVSMPASPVLRFASGAIQGSDSQILGQRLWVRSSTTLTEYSLASPLLPAFVRQVATPPSDGAVVQGDHATLTASLGWAPAALAVIDLTNPGIYPVSVGSLPRAGVTALFPVPQASRLYAARGAPGVEIFDITADLAKRDCSDGVDDDADGLVDFPADPGCPSPYLATLENPACNDGLDNDADTFVDLADAQCTSASHTSEAPAPAGCGLTGAEALMLAMTMRWWWRRGRQVLGSRRPAELRMIDPRTPLERRE